MTKLDIVVISDPGKFDAATSVQGWVDSGAHHAANVKTMVNQVLELVKGGDTIIRLRIIGHGNQNGQMIGSDWVDVWSLPRFREDLAKLTPHFEEDAVVTLGGCKVGYAQELMLRLSRIWGGITVRAGTASQTPIIPGIEGGVRSCKVDMCEYGGPGFWDHFDKYVGDPLHKVISRVKSKF